MYFLVTGATGFVGGQLVDRLLANGESVRALVRRPAAATDLRVRGADVHIGDLAGGGDLSEAVAGMDVVIHCAATVQANTSDGDVWGTNVGGTERLAAASAQAGVERFLFLSSAAVYGYAPPPISEDAPKNPVGPYGKSKWAAEEVVWDFYRKRGLPITILRPCTILGRSDQQFWQRLGKVLNRRVLPLPSGGRRLFDLVHISDVVDAAMAAVTNPLAIGRAYNITDGEAHTYRDIVEIYGQLRGHAPAIIPLPSQGMALLQQVLGGVLQRRGKASQADQVKMLGTLDMDLHYAIDAARTDLGYEPKVCLAAALGQVLAAGAQQPVGKGR